MAHEASAEGAGAGRLLREVQDHCLSFRGLTSRDLGGLKLGPIVEEVLNFALANDRGELTCAQLPVRRLLHIRAQLCGASAYMANSAWQRAVRFAEATDSVHAAKARQEQAAAAAAAPAEEVVQQKAQAAQPNLPAVAAASPLSAGQPANAAAAAAAAKPLVPKPPAGPPPAVLAGRPANAAAAAVKPWGPRPPAGPPPKASTRQGPYSA